jgi:ATP-dependent DNA ligase
MIDTPFGVEGYVARHPDAGYLPGRHWSVLKVKAKYL